MIVCVLLPRFRLIVAAGDRTELLQVPAALAPEPGRVQQVGEVSLAAEAFGLHPDMQLGEALARCPRLMLVPPDPAGVADLWERLLVRLESIGAALRASTRRGCCGSRMASMECWQPPVAPSECRRDLGSRRRGSLQWRRRRRRGCAAR
jgi:hypothetical protein